MRDGKGVEEDIAKGELCKQRYRASHAGDLRVNILDVGGKGWFC